MRKTAFSFLAIIAVFTLFAACGGRKSSGSGTGSPSGSSAGKPTLHITGLPSAGNSHYAVYVFPGDSDVSSLEAFVNVIVTDQGWLAAGVIWNPFELSNSNGPVWAGSGNFNVLLVNAPDINNPDTDLYWAKVNFSRGSAIHPFSDFKLIERPRGSVAAPDSNNEDTTLTITGLPGDRNYMLFVFPSGTDISTIRALANALNSGSLASATSFTHPFLFRKWTVQGNYPVLLQDINSMADDPDNAYSWATVNFSDGSVTHPFSDFKRVINDIEIMH